MMFSGECVRLADENAGGPTAILGAGPLPPCSRMGPSQEETALLLLRATATTTRNISVCRPRLSYLSCCSVSSLRTIIPIASSAMLYISQSPSQA